MSLRRKAVTEEILWAVSCAIAAAVAIYAGVDPVVACRASVAQALTDDRDMLVAVNELSSSLF